MPEERLVSITSSLHLAPDDVARHTFGSVRRGFDPNEVRAYLESVAAGLRTVGEREQELLKALADAEHRAANPVLDEPTLTAALGTETARVLHSAHEVAAEMVAKAEAEAARLLTEAREEIDTARTTTEAALEEQSGSGRGRGQASCVSGPTSRWRPDSTRPGSEAEELLSEAREQCRAMVDEAQGLRARVLADLAKRRKVLHAQIEQLRAGRERLAETVHDVRRSIDVIADELFTAEDNARLAAEAAGREVAGPVRGRHAGGARLAGRRMAGQAVLRPSGRPGWAQGRDGDLDVVEIGTAEVVVVEMLEDGPAGSAGDRRRSGRRTGGIGGRTVRQVAGGELGAGARRGGVGRGVRRGGRAGGDRPGVERGRGAGGVTVDPDLAGGRLRGGRGACRRPR